MQQYKCVLVDETLTIENKILKIYFSIATVQHKNL